VRPTFIPTQAAGIRLILVFFSAITQPAGCRVQLQLVDINNYTWRGVTRPCPIYVIVAAQYAAVQKGTYQ
jgi:hypothetical protein